MKFLKDIDVKNDLKFKKVRKTQAGAKIIDIDIELFQTGWCTILYDVDYAICTDVPEELEKVMKVMDDTIVNHCADVLDFCPQEITTMYRPILRSKGKNGYYFRMPISNASVMFNKKKEHHNKKEMKEILNIGNHVRFIIRMKKLYFKDYNLTVQMEMVQVDYN